MGDFYWASPQCSGKEYVAEVVQRRNDFDEHLVRTNQLTRMRNAANAYYGEGDDGHSTADIGTKGDEDQLSVLKLNQFRSVIQNKLTIATTSPPGFIPVPINSDHKSQASAMLSKGLVEYEMDEGGCYDKVYEATEMAEVLMSAALSVLWDESAGEVVAVDGEGNEVREGANRVRSHVPTDVIYDFRRKDKECPWIILRSRENRHELAARYAREDQAMAQEIVGLPAATDKDHALWPTLEAGDAADPDAVEVLEVFHSRTAAAPFGRCSVILGGTLLAKDGEYRYGAELPVRRVQSAARFGTPDSYTAAHDILGLQKACDVLTSIPYSNVQVTGGATITTKTGSNADMKKLGALKVVTYNGPDKPERLDLGQTPAEVYEFRERLKGDMAEQIGMDPLSMGADQRALSGAAMALLDSRTQRSVSSLTKSSVKTLQFAANQLVRNLRDFAPQQHARRVAMLVGKAKAPLMREFFPGELGGIDRIRCKEVSALMKSPAGRLEIATMLKDTLNAEGKPGITTEQLWHVIETGEFESLSEASEAERLNIRRENEALAEGTMVPVMASDNHPAHIKEHAVMFASPEVRADPDGDVAAVGLQHMQEHIDAWRGMDPALLVALGIPPAPLDPMAMAAAGAAGMAAGAEQAGGPPPPGEEQAAPGPNGAPDASGNPSMPSMPTNPSTGEEYSPTGDVGVA